MELLANQWIDIHDYLLFSFENTWKSTILELLQNAFSVRMQCWICFDEVN